MLHDFFLEACLYEFQILFEIGDGTGSLEKDEACSIKTKQKGLKKKYNKNMELMRNEYWLRQRNSQWQLKVAVKSHNRNEASSNLYRYQEFENLRAIYEKVDELLHAGKKARKLDESKTEPDLQLEKWLVEDCGLRPVSEFVTTRTRYVWKDVFHIEFDKSDFGYNVLEIECVLKPNTDQQSVAQASKELDTICQELGTIPSQSSPAVTYTKLQMHLWKFQPLIHDSLVKHNIFPKVSEDWIKSNCPDLCKA
ncbi:thiamine triphosphatase [Reticulomyxa filosa]|uniref:Thiamine triphosphatase n=1 Tax=Reticulomyxa filosa TaxID=46433 RepID=X6P110_RETFI|nr:thiamine triphosphatase [Reticulomyxa filosa]|eukprot:ETO31769.1 thiamine triphosphatase [Reticulomyxa filosa]